jgi:hypothetical protein
VIQEETAADYNQVLGDIDSLGQLNSWGNWPEKWIRSWHSTNSMLPLTMPVADLVKQDVRDEDPVAVDPAQLQTALRRRPQGRPAAQPVVMKAHCVRANEGRENQTCASHAVDVCRLR